MRLPDRYRGLEGKELEDRGLGNSPGGLEGRAWGPGGLGEMQVEQALSYQN